MIINKNYLYNIMVFVNCTRSTNKINLLKNKKKNRSEIIINILNYYKYIEIL